MWRFAAALPLRNFAGFRLREEDRDLDDFERRRRRVPVDRAPERFEPFRLRRRRPPPSETLDSGGKMPPTIHELTM